MARHNLASLRGLLIFMVFSLMAYTWYLMGTGSVVNYLKDHGLITKIDLLEGLLGGAFVMGAAVATICAFLRLFQAETEKCPDYLIRLANLLMLFAFGYGIRLFASMNKGTGLQVLENGGHLVFMVFILLVTLYRYEELERESGASQVEPEDGVPVVSPVYQRQVVYVFLIVQAQIQNVRYRITVD